MALHKPWAYMGSLGLHFQGIAAKLRDEIRNKIPAGYQDETGFHLGVKPAEKKIKWTPVW